jgi:hypothetical protein
MLRRVTARPALALVAVLLPACTGAPAPSRLEERSAVKAEPAKAEPAKAPPRPAAKPDPKPAPKPAAKPAGTPDPAADAAPGQLSAAPPPGAELLPVRLALKDASVYKVTTIAMVGFSGTAKPTGWAREERLELGGCRGEGFARRCDLTHRYVHFDAEPPQGRIFAADEQQVRDLVTRHALLATGARDGTTEVTGPAEQKDSPSGQALAEVHRFYCLRFPEQPIAVGAKWRDKCHARTGGVVDTRDVVWELTKVDTDADGRRRAELTYLGTYSAPGSKGPRTGTVSGLLYFLVDAGEPHLLKERIVTSHATNSAFHTTTTQQIQFARLLKDKRGREQEVRTDGEPFPRTPPPAAAPPDPPKPASQSPS